MWVEPIARALAATFPSTERLPGLDQIDPRPGVRRLLAEAPLAVRYALYGGALLYHCGPVITLGVPVLAGWLGTERRDRHAARLASHPIYLVRQAMLLLKSIGGLIWGADPAVRAVLGMPAYPPDPGTFREGPLPEPPRTPTATPAPASWVQPGAAP